MIKKIITYTLIAGLAILFVWTFWFLYQNSQKKPVVFQTDTLFYSDIVQKSVSAGSIVPRKEVAIKSQVSGIVDKLFVEAGQYIEKGELIARIRIVPNMANLNNAETNVEKAKLQLTQSETEYKRYKKLFDDDLIPEAEYNKYLLDYNQAKESLRAAVNNYDIVKDGATKQAGNATNLVRATVSGMVLDVPVEEGGFVIEGNTFNEGTTIAFIANMNDMIFLGKVDESEVGKIKPGMEVDLHIAAIDNKVFPATLEFISPKGITEDGAIKFEIKAAVKIDKTVYIRSGYSANADLVLQRRDSVLSVKESLIQFSGDSVYVEVETKPQEFKKQLIKTGLSDGIKAEVLSGVKLGDKIKVIVDKPKM
ncbi:efflux RND transporter periplasmic adaptor subunit [Cytophaga aurantiaca]|uniref:efflux RND transporter periplasmic adaptor subunit n=1 Tax=Cytophaga aurantiaca TaxID=29530 RepID=UPI00037C0FD5|nr:efflux RND transporter periplasmic adaptor subunit [Cytophaga aurantiaca]